MHYDSIAWDENKSQDSILGQLEKLHVPEKSDLWIIKQKQLVSHLWNE